MEKVKRKNKEVKAKKEQKAKSPVTDSNIPAPHANTNETCSSTLQKQRTTHKRSKLMKVHKPLDLTKVESRIRDKVHQDRQKYARTSRDNQESVGTFNIQPEGLGNKVEQSYVSEDQSGEYMRVRDILNQNSVLDVAEQVLNSDILNRLMRTPTLQKPTIKTGPEFYRKKQQPFLSHEDQQLKHIDNRLYSNRHSFNDIVRIRNDLSPQPLSQMNWYNPGNVFTDNESCKVVPKYDRQSKVSSKISYGFAR